MVTVRFSLGTKAKKEKKKKKKKGIKAGQTTAQIRGLEPVKKQEPKKEDVIRLGAPKDDVIRLGGEKKAEPSKIEQGLAKAGEFVSGLPIVKQVLEGQKKLAEAQERGDIKLIAQPVPLGLGGIATIGMPSLGPEKAATTALNIKSIQAGGSAFFVGKATKAGVAASQYATNTASVATTMSALSKIGLGVAAAGLFVATVGTYPFAGFIEEEALQTLSFAVLAATKNGDFEGAEEAFALQEEILNPTTWDKLMRLIPFANVQAELNDFKKAALAKLEIDKKVIADMKIQQETGETEDKKWERIRKEEEEQDKRVVDYYNDERKKMVEWERDAAKKARKEDATFWAKERAKQSQLEAEDRKAIADFWMAYRKEVYKIQQDNRPSNLNFGLL